jgi:hypothetical protein
MHKGLVKPHHHFRSMARLVVGWGSPKPVGDTRVRQLWLNIDAHATTILTKFDGDNNPFEEKGSQTFLL